jgi:hypothetical protein
LCCVAVVDSREANIAETLAHRPRSDVQIDLHPPPYQKLYMAQPLPEHPTPPPQAALVVARYVACRCFALLPRR